MPSAVLCGAVIGDEPEVTDKTDKSFCSLWPTRSTKVTFDFGMKVVGIFVFKIPGVKPLRSEASLLASIDPCWYLFEVVVVCGRRPKVADGRSRFSVIRAIKIKSTACLNDILNHLQVGDTPSVLFEHEAPSCIV